MTKIGCLIVFESDFNHLKDNILDKQSDFYSALFELFITTISKDINYFISVMQHEYK